MKKRTFTLLMILALTLSACGGSATEAASSAATSALTSEEEGALSVQLQLSVGTLALDGTAQAVDATQAAELLPLWQVLQSLTESDTAAQEEITALVTQIEETMTAEQIEAIAAMQLTREDMGAIMQEHGLQPAGRSGETADGTETGQGRGGGSGVPGMGGGPGGGSGETSLSPEQIATMQAERQANGGGTNDRLSGVIIEGVIQYLTSLAS